MFFFSFFKRIILVLNSRSLSISYIGGNSKEQLRTLMCFFNLNNYVFLFKTYSLNLFKNSKCQNILKFFVFKII